MPKIKAIPTSAQARLLKFLVDNPGGRILWNGDQAKVIGNYSSGIKASTIRKMLREQWLENQTQSILGISENGRNAVAGWDAEDLYAPPKSTITADDIYRRIIQKRYPAPGWFTSKEVTLIGEGVAHRRRIDAFVMRIGTEGDNYGFQYLTRIIYEIKVDRQDWLNESRDIYKRVTALEIANQFWLIMPAGIYKPGDEIPANCGLIEIYGNWQTRIVSSAPFVHGGQPDWYLLASLLRAAQR